MELRPGYKETEAGVIPEDWEVQKLGSITTFLDGMRRPVKSSDRARMKGSIPYYGASGIVDYVDDYIFDEELVLLGEDGENILSRNLPLAFRISGKTWVNNHAHVIRPSSDISIGFLTEYLDSLNYESLNSGTAQPKLNKQNCLQIPVALPSSSEEQNAIATVLSDADALLLSLERLICKKRNLKQACMQQLLTGETRLHGFEKNWDSAYLPDVLVIRKGDLMTSSRLRQGNIPVVAGGINPAYYHDTFNRRGPCVTISASGANAGFVAFYQEPIFASDCSTIEGSDYISSKFAFYKLKLLQNEIFSLQTGGAQPHVQPNDLARLMISFPSRTEQDAIVLLLSDMDSEIEALETRLEKTRDLKRAMTQELLTGKTRLVTLGESNA